jgi:hypothetical protein
MTLPRVINRWLAYDAEAAWRAAGGLTKNGTRWIPSVVLVQNYNVVASANYGGFTRTVDGETYRVGDRTHIEYGLGFVSSGSQRKFWSTLAHEYAHNFLEFGDLYGPPGAAGYYDLLGDRCGAGGRMSEVSSVHKERVGWLEYNEVIEGPYYSTTEFTLEPYTTSGDAIKIVPDPDDNPHEYFVLEYRRSTGDESWRPDGGLDDEGLLITHMNERLGIPNNFQVRDAPYYDPEFADHSDAGGAERVSLPATDDTFYPNDGKDSFTPFTTPNSDFYGGRRSDLYVRDIRTEYEWRGGLLTFRRVPVVKFTVVVLGPEGSREWSVGSNDRGVSGRFTSSDPEDPDEIFLRNENEAALLTHSEAKWFVEEYHDDWIGGWNLGTNDREYVGDLDGDGKDELYVRSDNWAGVIESTDDGLDSRAITNDWILARDLDMDGWNLGANDRENLGDFDGDGADEVYVRSDDWAGIITLDGDRLDNEAITHDRIGEWDLRAQDAEFVGRFSRTDRDEILVRSNDWIGLLYYDDSARTLRCENLQHDWVDSWNLGKTDRHVVGDFDGDGYDEIFIRGENRWSGVIEWQNGRFTVKWMTQGDIEHESGNGTLTPSQSDEYYSGQFLPNPVWHSHSSTTPKPDRDGVLLVQDAGKPLSVLTWEGDAMEVRFANYGGQMEWRNDDGIIVGDFHGHGPDDAKPNKDSVSNGAADVFVHNDWGTGMVGITYVENNPLWKPGKSNEEMGITWEAGRVPAESRLTVTGLPGGVPARRCTLPAYCVRSSTEELPSDLGVVQQCFPSSV